MMCEGFQGVGALNWISVMPRNVNLSNSAARVIDVKKNTGSKNEIFTFGWPFTFFSVTYFFSKFSFFSSIFANVCHSYCRSCTQPEYTLSSIIFIRTQYFARKCVPWMYNRYLFSRFFNLDYALSFIITIFWLHFY